MIRELLHNPRPAETLAGGKASPESTDKQKGAFSSLLASLTNASTKAEGNEQVPVEMVEAETKKGTSSQAEDQEQPVMIIGDQVNEIKGEQPALEVETVLNTEAETNTKVSGKEQSLKPEAVLQDQSDPLQGSTESTAAPNDKIKDTGTVQLKEGQQQIESEQKEVLDRGIKTDSGTNPNSSDTPVFSTLSESGMYPGSSLSSDGSINLKAGSQNVEIKPSDHSRPELAAAIKDGKTVLTSEGNKQNLSLASSVSQVGTKQADSLSATQEQQVPEQLLRSSKTTSSGSNEPKIVDETVSKMTLNDGSFRIVTERAAAEQMAKNQQIEGKHSEANSGRTVEGERSAFHASAAEGIRSDRLINMGIDGVSQPFANIEKQETEAFQQDLFKDIQLSSEEIPDLPEAEQQRQSSMRMGEFTIQNELVRRSILPSVSQVLSTATSEGKEMNAQWQKHRVELENGSNIRLSTRQVDGVIQLRIGSDNPELTKILQQNLDEIKARLEEEFDMKVELDLESNGSEQQASNGFFEQGDGSGKNRARTAFLNREQSSAEEHKQSPTIEHSVRRFGYNQMEWTA